MHSRVGADLAVLIPRPVKRQGLSGDEILNAQGAVPAHLLSHAGDVGAEQIDLERYFLIERLPRLLTSGAEDAVAGKINPGCPRAAR